MTLTKTTLAAIISIAMLATVSTTALAQNGNRANMINAQRAHQGTGYQYGNRANLTSEQQAVSQKAFDEFQSKTADLRQQLMSKQYEYQALLTSKPLDEQKVLAVSKEITALRDNLYQKRVALNTDLAKAGVPMMGHERGGAGMHCGRGCR